MSRLKLLKSAVGKSTEEGPSPAGGWLSGILVSAESGEIKIRYTIRREMTNPVGSLHGGMISLMMDEVIGISVASLDLEFFFTSLNLQVDFLKFVREGTVVDATGRVLRKGSRIIHGEAEIHTAEGELIARGSSILLKSDLPAVGINKI